MKNFFAATLLSSALALGACSTVKDTVVGAGIGAAGGAAGGAVAGGGPGAASGGRDRRRSGCRRRLRLQPPALTAAGRSKTSFSLSRLR